MSKYKFTTQEWEHCLKVLQILKDDPYDNPNNQLLSGLITKVYKTSKKLKSKVNSNVLKTEDTIQLKSTVIAKNALNNISLYGDTALKQKEQPEYQTLHKPRNCYACNSLYKDMHFFYGRMCPSCAELNYEKRFESIDLSNRNVILTGGRVKVGYATALKLLRANANLVITTRFPASALHNFKQETDYEQWKDQLTVYGLDLRNLKAVEQFIAYYKSQYESLDILINNAAQTIKYDDTYYLPIVQKEQQLALEYHQEQRLICNPNSVLNNTKLLENSIQNIDFEMNRFGQPIDRRTKTSWNSTLEEVSMYELLEVNLINQISPYFMIKEFTPLFQNSSFDKRFIINVTSSEGQFSYHNKTQYHPHTNMTKAALNMLTKTSGSTYKYLGIYMYAVDVGWISTGAQEALRQKQFDQGYIPPLDSVDGAARIMHPIFEGLIGNPILVGTLLKNYVIENW
jgi:NAD(P)-dependent dehydrogenase (short-subunit alcohol dehydrogenase family)